MHIQFQVEGEGEFTTQVFDAAGNRIGNSIRSVEGRVSIPSQDLGEGVYVARITTKSASLVRAFAVAP